MAELMERHTSDGPSALSRPHRSFFLPQSALLLDDELAGHFEYFVFKVIYGIVISTKKQTKNKHLLLKMSIYNNS